MKHRRLSVRLALPALMLTLGGCVDDDPVSPGLEVRAFSALGGFEPGEAVTLQGPDAERLFLTGGADGAEYLVVPFHAVDDGRATLRLEIEGDLSASGRTSVSRAPDAARSDLALRLDGRAAPHAVADESPFHLRLRQWEQQHARAGMGGVARSALRSGSTERSLSLRAQQLADPQVGQIVTLQAPDPEGVNLCTDYLPRPGRVVAVTEHAVLVVDTLNPGIESVDDDLLEIAQEFDDLVYPVDVENFGEPSDIDENGRAVIFITAVVNAMTPPRSEGYIAGFFFGGDLLPSGRPGSVFGEDVPPAALCPASNEAEIFYIIAPDPSGEVNQNPRDTELVVAATTGIIAHEFQHLINLSRRLYVNQAAVAEEVWLNEALSHIAEELVFYQTAGLEPRQNLGDEALRQSAEVLTAFVRFAYDNVLRYYLYLSNPDEESLLGIDELPTRGAAWAFLRYAADHEEGPDKDFFFDLVNSSSSGVTNLNTVLADADAVDLMQTWTTSVFTDDYPALNPRGLVEPVASEPLALTQPSWNFRSIFIDLLTSGEFPLAVIDLDEAGTVPLTLQGGGAAYIRTEVEAGEQAPLNITSGGVTAPEQLRITVVRLR